MVNKTFVFLAILAILAIMALSRSKEGYTDYARITKQYLIKISKDRAYSLRQQLAAKKATENDYLRLKSEKFKKRFTLIDEYRLHDLSLPINTYLRVGFSESKLDLTYFQKAYDSKFRRFVWISYGQHDRYINGTVTTPSGRRVWIWADARGGNDIIDGTDETFEKVYDPTLPPA